MKEKSQALIKQKEDEEGSRVDAKAAVVPPFLAGTEGEGSDSNDGKKNARNTVDGLHSFGTRGRTKRRGREHEIPMDSYHSQRNLRILIRAGLGFPMATETRKRKKDRKKTRG